MIFGAHVVVHSRDADAASANRGSPKGDERLMLARASIA